MSTVTTRSHHVAAPSVSNMNTLPDPRTPSPHSLASRSPAIGTEQHPDLSSEVATLSTKLINAINHQTTLDDALQESKHELTTARAHIAELERQVHEQNQAMEQGILVRRVDAMRIQEKLRGDLGDEKKKRENAEREKKGMEQELENLTSQLFEEANGMVASARHDKEGSDKKLEQLQMKLEEKDVLLASHQEQLQDLKAVMQQIQEEQVDAPHTFTTPSTPINQSHDKVSSSFDFAPHIINAASNQSLAGEHPLSFSHLLQPAVRNDTQAFEEFVGLLRTTNGSSSRATSGSYMGLNVMGLGKDLASQSSVVSSQPRSGNASRSNSANHTPIPGQFSTSPNPSMEVPSSSGSLKETKFYKRVLVEDIEPTLRLDLGPSLSWLTRRNVLSGMATGHLIVEPVSRSRFPTPSYPCSLCGESRTGEEHARKWRFRTSDSEEAQRYPLCEYCLTRVRATCDFTNFLRLVKNGHYKSETPEDHKTAWDDCTKLRERMFWTRLGGGVVLIGSHFQEQQSSASSFQDTSAPSNSQASHAESDTVSGSGDDAAASDQLRGEAAAAGEVPSKSEARVPPPLPIRTAPNEVISSPLHDAPTDTISEDDLATSPPHSEPVSPDTLQRFSTPPLEKSSIESRNSLQSHISNTTATQQHRSSSPTKTSPTRQTQPRPSSPLRPKSRDTPTLRTLSQSPSFPPSSTNTSSNITYTLHQASDPRVERSPSPTSSTGLHRTTSSEPQKQASSVTAPAQTSTPGSASSSRPSTPRKNNLVAALASKFQEQPPGGDVAPLRRPFGSGSGRAGRGLAGADSASQSRSPKRGSGSQSPVRGIGNATRPVLRREGTSDSFKSTEER